MTGKTIDRLVAAGVFVYALVLYLLTMAETSPFWDSGEFIAISNGLQVSHPPGAPFYMLVGRFFAFFAGLFGAVSPEPVAFAVNLVSVVASAATVLLTHLVIVRLARAWLGAPEAWAGWQRAAALGGGAIGALTFAATDSFWFNAVEAEVYALSMLFTAAVVWLALIWAERTREEEQTVRARGQHPFGLHADRLLVAIAYLFGLAIGVHLLNVLALFFVALIVYFEKVEAREATLGQNALRLGATGLVAAVIFVAIYPGVVQWLPSMAAAFGSPLAFLFLVVAALTAAVWWTHKNHKPVANLIALSATVVILGYSSYAVIFIRSAADPPIDENDPETAEAIVSYLKREQFGDTPLFRGTNYDTPYVYDSRGEVRRTSEGFPMREQELFPRRHSEDPNHINVYREYSGDLDYFLRYQLGHMFGRYFMWQFAGRAADTQDSGWIAFPWQKADGASLSPSERAGQNAYWGLPLLLGLLGFLFHTQKDWRRSLAVGALFIISGVGIIVYLNQTPLQPRERDYAYVGAFFAFSLWIGIGATGLMQLVAEALKNSPAAQRIAPLAVAALAFVAVPGWMAAENYDDHDRSGRRIATDFAQNMLESTAPNAILFTNGDNDTFPLWYAQEVMGIRRDVRVVNLSLLNTPWYIKQLKNQASRESAPIPFTLTDSQVDALRPVFGFEPGDVSLPVDPDRIFDERVAGTMDRADIPTSMTWRLGGRSVGPETRGLYVADLAVLDILKANADAGWERPVYFAATVGPDSELDLQPFLQNEGLARRVVPIRREGIGQDGFVVPEVAAARLAKYKFQGLADPDVYLDENARNMADSYRRTVGGLATGLASGGREAEARAILTRLDAEVPRETVPASFFSLYTLSEAYAALGDTEKLVATLRPAEAQVLAQAQEARTQDEVGLAWQFYQTLMLGYLRGDAIDAAAAFSTRFANAIGDPRVAFTADELREQAAALDAPPEASGDVGAAAGVAPADEVAPDTSLRPVG